MVFAKTEAAILAENEEELGWLFKA